MLKNNNKDIIRRLNRRILKGNRLRNTIAVVAIILTTFMFTTIFSIGYSLVNNINNMLLMGQGSRASVYLDNPSSEQIDEVKACSEVLAAGLRVKVDTALDGMGKNKCQLMWYDETEFEENLLPAIKCVEGKYPEKENEIMLSVSLLNSIGYDSFNIGDKIELIIDDKPVEFVLSGYYTGFSPSNPCLVSEALVKEKGKTVTNDGYMSISSKADKNDAMISELTEKVPLREGQQWDSIFDVQAERGENIVAMVISMCLISLLVLASGYLLIYNVMYISVARDIRFYGMLKTIGTSSAQIKRLVRLQSLYLSAIGIPLGLLLGTITSFGIIPIATNMISANRAEQLSTEVTFNVYIYAFAIIFAVATVFISVRKPAKLASKVSPIEALRYYADDSAKGIKVKSKKNDREYKGGQKVRTMALRNVFRDKKRARLVFASLFLGVMVFLCVNTFIKSLSADNYLANYFFYDYALYIDVTSGEIPGVQEGLDRYDTTSGKLPEEIAEAISSLNGISYCHVNRYAYADLDFDRELYKPFLYYAVSYQGGESLDALADALEESMGEFGFGACVVSVDRRMIEDYNKKARHKVDVDSFMRGEVCLVGYVGTDEGSVEFTGNTLSLKNSDTGKSKEIAVGATAVNDEKYGIVTGYTWTVVGAPQFIMVSDSFMEELFPDASVIGLVADATKDKEPELATMIYQMYKSNECIEAAEIKSVESEEFKKSMISLSVISGGISGILILIGLMNFVNVMLTSVYTRSKEIATLESVGMTKKQLKKMLVYEGLVYGSGSILLILSLGSLMVFGVGRLSVKLADYAIPNYPVGETVILAVLILLISALAPLAIFKEITKKTVTERIREQ